MSCASAAACIAVGFTQGGPGGTLAESWNGTRWSVVPSPTPGTGQTLVNGVSCSSKDACNVVGSYNTETKILVESWDGRSWSVVPTPNPGTTDHVLNGVSCVSPGCCMAAGFFFSRHPSYRTLTLLGTAPG